MLSFKYNVVLLISYMVKEESVLILKLEKYGMIHITNNWVVGKVTNASPSQSDANGKDLLDAPSQTYHPTFEMALKALSRRILEDKLKIKAKEKTMEIKEVLEIIKAHDVWIKEVSKEI